MIVKCLFFSSVKPPAMFACGICSIYKMDSACGICSIYDMGVRTNLIVYLQIVMHTSNQQYLVFE